MTFANDLVCSSSSPRFFYPSTLCSISYGNVQLVVEPEVRTLCSTMLVTDHSLILTMKLNVGLIAIRTLILLERLSYLLKMLV